MADKKDGGDIASGFGDSEVDGPVSDAKAQEMLYGDVTEAVDVPTDSVFAVDADGTAQREDASDDAPRPETGGGGGGGGW